MLPFDGKPLTRMMATRLHNDHTGLAGGHARRRLEIYRGRSRPSRPFAEPPPPQEVEMGSLSPQEHVYLEQSRPRHLMADATKLCEQIDAIARPAHAREEGLLTICNDFEARKRSYERIARDFGLAAET